MDEVKKMLHRQGHTDFHVPGRLVSSSGVETTMLLHT